MIIITWYISIDNHEKNEKFFNPLITIATSRSQNAS